MSRIRLSALVLMTVLVVLSITQILIDRRNINAPISGSIAEDLKDLKQDQNKYSIFIEIEDKTLSVRMRRSCTGWCP